MSWDKNSKDDGPWGKAPINGGGGNNNEPDIDELLKRAKEKFDQFFSGGGPNAFLLIALGVIVLWAASGFYTIDAKEQGVVLRFGKFHRTEAPGLHYRFPYPFERLYKIPVTVVNSVSVGKGNQERLMLTGDENIVDIEFEVQWVIRDAKSFLFNINDPENTVRSVAESAMREVIGRTPISSALAEGKFKIQQESHKLIQEVLDSYESGIEVAEFQLGQVKAPAPVEESFKDVVNARQDMDRMKNEAEAYANDIIPRARGEGKKMVLDAEAYKEQVVAKSEGEASRFVAVYDKYKLAKNVTKRRMYLEMMEEVLQGMNKVLVDNKGGSGVVPFLPLNELGSKKTKVGE
jgi:membrane protease subunit HflK